MPYQVQIQRETHRGGYCVLDLFEAWTRELPRQGQCFQALTQEGTLLFTDPVQLQKCVAAEEDTGPSICFSDGRASYRVRVL